MICPRRLDAILNAMSAFPSLDGWQIRLYYERDWSAFDKTVCGIALMDSDGNVVYGNIPSVSECKSYDTPSLLEPLYVWRF